MEKSSRFWNEVRFAAQLAALAAGVFNVVLAIGWSMGYGTFERTAIAMLVAITSMLLSRLRFGLD